jgi:1-acylglycerone phosphate reductase
MGDLGLKSPNINLLSLDVTGHESIVSAHDKIHAAGGGKLDILYHNAGYRSLSMALDTTADEALKTFNTNLFGIIDV